jgi:hypothetical protein
MYLIRDIECDSAHVCVRQWCDGGQLDHFIRSLAGCDTCAQRCMRRRSFLELGDKFSANMVMCTRCWFPTRCALWSRTCISNGTTNCFNSVQYILFVGSYADDKEIDMRRRDRGVYLPYPGVCMCKRLCISTKNWSCSTRRRRCPEGAQRVNSVVIVVSVRRCGMQYAGLRLFVFDSWHGCCCGLGARYVMNGVVAGSDAGPTGNLVWRRLSQAVRGARNCQRDQRLFGCDRWVRCFAWKSVSRCRRGG